MTITFTLLLKISLLVLFNFSPPPIGHKWYNHMIIPACQVLICDRDSSEWRRVFDFKNVGGKLPSHFTHLSNIPAKILLSTNLQFLCGALFCLYPFKRFLKAHEYTVYRVSQMFFFYFYRLLKKVTLWGPLWQNIRPI